MTNTMNHTDCDHPRTKAARAACRKARAKVDTQALDLLEVFSISDYMGRPDHWVFYAARRFASYEGTDRIAAARAVLDYFLPSGDEDRDERRRANGYTITTDLYTMRTITLRAAS